jgi:hypothetical protein
VWFLLLIATHDKYARWLGGSTAGPSHSEKSSRPQSMSAV